MASAVQTHPCGATVYVLTGPDGQTLTLDTTGLGPWWPDGDGRTAQATASDCGLPEHRCVPEGQETLL